MQKLLEGIEKVVFVEGIMEYLFIDNGLKIFLFFDNFKFIIIVNVIYLVGF